MHRSIVTSFCVFFVIFSSCGKKETEYLAKVGDRYITADEFRERLDHFLISTSAEDNLLLRKNLLDGMVSEALLLAEARRRGMEDDAEYKRRAQAIEIQALLDAYRRNVVYDTVTVSEEEIKQAFARLNQKVSARHLYARTEDEARELLDQLRSGVSFEELAARTFRDSTLAANGGYLGYFGVGDMDPAFEEAAFSLKVEEISEPIKTAYGYSIIKVEDRLSAPLATEYEYQRRRQTLQKAVKRERSIQAAKRLASNLAGTLDLQFRDPALGFIMNELRMVGDDAFAESDLEGGGVDAGSQYASQEELVRFGGQSWTIRDFLERARHTSERQRKRITDVEELRDFIRGLIVRDMLLENARNAGLHSDAEVCKTIRQQLEGYLITRLRQDIVDTVQVPEWALQAQYEQSRDLYFFPEEVNVQEILVESKEKAQAILERIKDGEDFALLAREYSKREWAAERGGELGFAPKGRFGALGDTIFVMQVGDVKGPLEIAGYYSIVKLIGRKQARHKTFEEARAQVEAELMWQWRDRAYKNYLDDLQQKFEITTNESLLKEIVLN